MVPANADSKPAALERWIANTALDATLERETKELKNPIQPTDENLITGVHLYAENCAICHGASDAMPSNLAQGFYIEAPQFAKDGVEDDPERTSFWKVKHGIRFTAMPSFATTLQEEEKTLCCTGGNRRAARHLVKGSRKWFAPRSASHHRARQ